MVQMSVHVLLVDAFYSIQCHRLGVICRTPRLLTR
jgi:hypothetical protein